MKKKLIPLKIIGVLLAFYSVQAQEKEENVETLEEVVISATRFAVKKELVGKIIYQIKPDEIAQSKGKSVIEVLDQLAGIQINGINSTAGKNKSVYIRGGRDRQVIVLIDGVALGDPTGINTSFDLRLLTLSQIESIEVMNGAASTLYGTGAATGVINIKLKKAPDNSFAMNYQTSIGTNNSQKNRNSSFHDLNQNAMIRGTINKFSYLASINSSKIDGFSEADDQNSSVRFEDDNFLATNTLFKIGYRFSDHFTIQLFNNYDKNVYEYDAGAFTDSDINNGVDKQLRFGLSSELKYNKGSVKLTLSHNKIDRKFDNYNSWTDGTDHFEYLGKTTGFDMINNYKISDQIQLITGVNYQKQENKTTNPYAMIDSDLANYNILDPYVTVVYISKFGFNINVGARFNTHSEYGNHWVYNINPSYNFSSKFRILSSYSTAFIAPSTYQLYSQYGNLDLRPEEDRSIEVGFSYKNDKLLEVSSVFFYREENHAIILPDFVTYRNGDDRINAKGIETFFTLKTFKNLQFKIGHAYTLKSADIDYIPKNKTTIMVGTKPFKKMFVSLQAKSISNSSYYDQWGSNSTIDIKGFSLLDFYCNYSLKKDKVTLFIDVNNILNEKFIETIGYTSKGRNVKIGLDFTF